MGEHKLKEKQAQAVATLKKELKQRLLADDVTVEDFIKIDDDDFGDSCKSTNSVTEMIWQDIRVIISKYITDVSSWEECAKEVFNEIGDAIADKLKTTQLPYDNRFYSEIMEDEHMTLEVAKTYKTILNIGISCEKANTLSATRDKVGKYTGIEIVRMHEKRREYEGIVWYGTKQLLSKMMFKIKVKDLVA